MRRFPPLSRLRLILGASHPKALPSSQNSNFVRQLRLSSPLEISPSHSSPFRSFINSFPISSRALFSSSSSSSSPANIVSIGSEEGFNTALKKATDEKLPSIFYFTAVWCGPCRVISPLVEQMSKELPHVTTYKLDIDQESLTDTLKKLQIFSVPTILFFHNGEKDSEIVGADITKLKVTMERLYNYDPREDAIVLSCETKCDTWVLDSGASFNATSNKKFSRATRNGTSARCSSEMTNLATSSVEEMWWSAEQVDVS